VCPVIVWTFGGELGGGEAGCADLAGIDRRSLDVDVLPLSAKPVNCPVLLVLRSARPCKDGGVRINFRAVRWTGLAGVTGSCVHASDSDRSQLRHRRHVLSPGATWATVARLPQGRDMEGTNVEGCG